MADESTDPVAVIGFSCRFGGDGFNNNKFWTLLRDGRSALSSGRRFDKSQTPSSSDDPSPSSPYAGYYIDEDPYVWDAQFFGVSAKEAEAIDPSQRLMLEVAYEAFENSGIPINVVSGSKTSCYIGQFVTDYREMIFRDPLGAPTHTFTGTGTSNISNRVSWFFDLRGPSFTLNTACSSSMVALHEACESLRRGESDMSLVGGSNLLLSTELFQFQRNLGFLASDGRCKTFDVSADGYGRGEGVAALILKPLTKALRDGNAIRAVIRGTGVNQNGGRTQTLTRPSTEAQAELIENTYSAAGLSFAETQVVEAHGTGTKVGDPAEIAAIGKTISKGRRESILVTSSKPNIGHTEATAGLAGIVKSIFALEAGLIPPNIYLDDINPDLELERWGVQIPTVLTSWPFEGLRRISVLSSGYGGTNAHVILDDAYHYMDDRGITGLHFTDSGNSTPKRAELPIERKKRLYVLSMKDEGGIRRLRATLSDHLKQFSDTHETTILKNLAYTLSHKRSRFPWSISVIASSLAEIRSNMVEDSDADKAQPIRKALADPRLCFVFTGQGAQWPQMGRELYAAYDLFRQNIDSADAYFCAVLGCPWSVQEQLFADPSASRINEPSFSQPLCTVLQVALVDLLESWNVRPRFVVGHSSGEIAAAYCRGALFRQDAWKIAYYRGLLSSQMHTHFPTLKGGMMAVSASEEEAEEYISNLASTANSLVVACLNSPKSVTISGDIEELERLEASLKAQGVFARRLKVSTAYHSPHMERIANDYIQAIMDVQPHEGDGDNCTMVSAVTGEIIDPLDLGPTYWMRNLVSPVRFADAAQKVLESREGDPEVAANVFMEVGPHSAMKGPLKQIVDDFGIKSGIEYVSLLLREQNAVSTVLDAAGTLYGLGFDVDVGAINGTSESSIEEDRANMLIDLPPYPFNHSRSFRGFGRLEREYQQVDRNPTGLLGVLTPTMDEHERTWRRVVQLDKLPWLSDHVIEGAVLFPAAGYLVLAVEAAQQMIEPGKSVIDFKLRDIVISSALVVRPEADIEIVVQLRPHHPSTRDRAGTWTEFTISSSSSGSDGLQENCNGLLAMEYAVPSDSATYRERDLDLRSAQADFDGACKACSYECNDIKSFYEGLADKGLQYGPTFAKLTDFQRGNWQICCSVESHSWESEHVRIIHPATLDAMFHAVFAAMPEIKGAMVPTLIDEVTITPNSGSSAVPRYRGSARARRSGLRDIIGDVHMFDPESMKRIVDLRGICLRSTGNHRPDSKEMARPICSRLTWQPLPHEDLVSGKTKRIDPPQEVVIVICDLMEQHELAQLITDELATLQIKASTVEWEHCTEAVKRKTCISLCDIHHSKFWDCSTDDFNILQNLLCSCSDVLWVASGDLGSSIISGLARTVRNEIPTLRFRNLQVDIQALEGVAPTLASLATSPTMENEFRVEVDGKPKVPRLVDDIEQNSRLLSILEDEQLVESMALERLEDIGPVELTIENPGMLDSLCLGPTSMHGPAVTLSEDELEIRVHASGMNFRDVMVAMGQIPDMTMGFEASGVVEAVGSGVTRFQVGDRVCALGTGAHCSKLRTKEDFAQHMPAQLSFETASTLPLVYATAYNAIIRVAQARQNQSILIHAAAGGVGQAAIQLAKHIGMKIFVTVGSEDKRAFLRETYGIDEEDMFSSRDTSFAMAVKRRTNGRGVDVILNSLAGEALRQSWYCIAPFGTFVEIGLRDIQNNFGLDMQPFMKDATFSFFNLSHMMEKRSEVVREVLDGVFDLIREDILKPVSPVTVYSISEVEQAYRTMQTGKHRGKIALTWDREQSVPALVKIRSKSRLREDATYVLAGGTGGIGRSLALLLADLGAKHICFISRSGNDSSAVKTLLKELRSRDVQSLVYKGDISDMDALSEVWHQIGQEHPPIRGVINAAMVLRDTLFEKMTFEQWQESLRPKVTGSINLSRLTGSDADFFIMLSSFVSIFGNPTQANYAAACAAQDALAHERRAEGQAAVSIDLGIMREVGYLAEQGSTGLLKQWEQPFGLNEAELHALILIAISGDAPAQLITGFATGGGAAAAGIERPVYFEDPKFAILAETGLESGQTAPSTSPSSNGDVAQVVSNSKTAGQAQQLIVDALCTRVAKSIQINATDIDSSRPLSAFGVDSLVAVEIRSWVFNVLKANISMFDINSSIPITTLGQKIASVCELLPEELRK